MRLDEVATCLGTSIEIAERVMARMGAPMTADQFSRWITSFPSGADILTAPPPPVPAPDDGPGSALVSRRGCVYFIEAVGTNRIKIGFTSKKTPHERLESLQTACPYPLAILGWYPGSMATELALHERFASLRVMPRAEWFHAAKDLRRLAKNFAEAMAMGKP